MKKQNKLRQTKSRRTVSPRCFKKATWITMRYITIGLLKHLGDVATVLLDLVCLSLFCFFISFQTAWMMWFLYIYIHTAVLISLPTTIEFIKLPCCNVYITLNLNTVCCFLSDPRLFLFCDSCSWVPCLSWAVQLPAVLQTNPPAPAHSLFSSIFCICELFPTVTVWFWDPSFPSEDNWRNDTQLLQKVKIFTHAREGHTRH